MKSLALASLFVFALGLVPIGLWQPGEPTMVGLLLVASGAAWGARSWPRALWPVVGLAVLSVLLLPFLPFPMRSWLGTPELGLGGAWWAALAVLASVMAGIGRGLDQWALIAGAMIFALVLLYPEWLLVGNDWAAFVGFALMAEESWLGLVLAVPLVLFSDSKGAMALGLCLGCLLMVPAVLDWIWSHRWLRAALALGAPAGLTVATFLMPFPSLHSRALLWRAVGEGLWAQPWLLLHGVGWGGYNDLLLTVRPKMALVDPTWEGLGGGAFAAHSMYVEALSTLGVPGLLGMLAVVAVPAWYCTNQRALVAWVGIAGLMAIWFPLNQCVPFIAYALSRCSRA